MDQGTQRLIRRHNAQMRDLIVRDIDALEQKLNVKRQVTDMADNAVDTVKGKLGMNNRNPNEGWVDFIRHNAAPLAAVGLGGAVLARNLQSRVGHSVTSTSPRAGERHFDPTHQQAGGLREQVGSKLSDATDTASEGLSTAKEQVSEKTHAVGEKAVEARDAVAAKATVVKDAVVEHVPSREEMKVVARDHSQVVGVAALAVGAVAGVLTPRTKAEERRLAPVQSQVREKASELADQGIEKAKEQVDLAAGAVSAGIETAKEELESSGDEPDPGGSMVSGATELPDLTRPNRITGSRIDETNGMPGTRI